MNSQKSVELVESSTLFFVVFHRLIDVKILAMLVAVALTIVYFKKLNKAADEHTENS